MAVSCNLGCELPQVKVLFQGSPTKIAMQHSRPPAARNSAKAAVAADRSRSAMAERAFPQAGESWEPKGITPTNATLPRKKNKLVGG